MWKKITPWFAVNGAIALWIVLGTAALLYLGVEMRPFAISVGNTFSAAMRTGTVSWANIVAAIAVSLASLIVPFISIALLWFACDTFFYYRTYRRPYLLVLFGRELPRDDKKTEFDAANIVMLQNAVRKAIEGAQHLLAPPIDAWGGSERYLEALWHWQSEQFGLIQDSFNRLKGRDKVRAFLMGVRQTAEEAKRGTGDLVFLPVRKNSPSPPLRIERSIAGRAILSTVDEALEIVNVANALLDPDFEPHGSGHGLKSLLCIPILYQDESKRRMPLFLLSIDSRVDEAFPPEHVTAARSIAVCLGLALQRFVDLAKIDEKKKKSGPDGPPPAAAGSA